MDGIIQIDSKQAKEFGFTSDKFSKDSYLWKEGKNIYISLIFSNKPGNGDFSKLLKSIWAGGCTVKVPTPFSHMKTILRYFYFTKTFEETEMGECEVWVKSPTCVGDSA